MVCLIPHETLQRIRSKCPCRQAQLRQLVAFYNQHLPSPPLLVAYGLDSTDKLDTVVTLLAAIEFDFAVVKSSECLSQRHLLSKTFAACVRKLGSQHDLERYDRLDSINALVVNLKRLFEKRQGRFVLVIDGIDRQRGALHTLLSSLARLGDVIPSLSIILTTSSPRPLQLHRSGIIHVHFPPYTRNEAIRFVVQNPPPLQPESLPDDFPSIGDSTLSSIWSSFAAAVYDTLIVHTSSTSVPFFQRMCEKLWPRFIWPMLSNEPILNRNSSSKASPTWDFARLLVRNRPLFQRQGETALIPKLCPTSEEIWTFQDLLKQHEQRKDGQSPDSSEATTMTAFQSETIQQRRSSTPLLKFFSTLLLLSAYLASHTPPKHDIILFSRLSSSSSHKRKYLSSALSKNRVRKTPTKSRKRTSTAAEDSATTADSEATPSKSSQGKKRSKALAAADATLAPEKTHKSTRLQFEKTSSIPKPFSLERLIAILRAVHPDALSRTKGVADRVYGEMVELERLRLVVRLGTGANAGMSAVGSGSGGSMTALGGSGSGGAVGAGGDSSAGAASGGATKGTDEGVLEEKWRVNVGREVVVEMGMRWGIGVEGWEID